MSHPSSAREITGTSLKQSLVPLLEAALHAVDAHEAVLAHVERSGEVLRIGERTYRLAGLNRIFVVGAGKAGAPMAAAIAEVVGERVAAGCVNVKYGHVADSGRWRVYFGRPEVGPVGLPAVTGPIRIVEAGHPLPDVAGLSGARRMVDMLQGLTDRDLVLVLLSGGGSALLPAPAADLTLADLQAVTNLLLRAGADIRELNTVRKHCSAVQGGQLARLAAPAQVATLILSDVVGSPLDTIASGPTTPDRSSYADTMAILERYKLGDRVPASVLAHIKQGAAGLIPETPKPGDPLFERVYNLVIGDNESAARALVAAARRKHWHAQLLTTFVQGEAREVGRALAGLAQGIALGASDCPRPACLVLGGETTVTVRGEGQGGRNQELVLAAAIALDGYPLGRDLEVGIVSMGTDGTDGPTDAAGAVATPDTLARGWALGLDARAALARNDSYPYLGALGDLLITGPTNTNVNDLMLVCVT
jgi:hydroxypyruvate reductase